jgi:hypothetical protein
VSLALRPLKTTPPPAASVSLGDRIAANEAQIRELRRQQRAQFLVTIASVVPGHVDFNAAELFAFRAQSPALADAFTDLRIRNARSLGRRLQQIDAASVECAGLRLRRLGHDHTGVVWALR